MLPCLEGDVGATKVRVGEAEADLDVKLEVVGEVSILWKGKQLAAGNEGSFGIGDGQGWKDKG